MFVHEAFGKKKVQQQFGIYYILCERSVSCHDILYILGFLVFYILGIFPLRSP